MAAPERFAKRQIPSCTAGTVHTWPITTLAALQANVRLWEYSVITSRLAEDIRRDTQFATAVAHNDLQILDRP